VIQAIGGGVESIPFDAETDRVVADFVRELLRSGQVGDEAYDAAKALLGEKGTVELVGLVGYYSLLAMQLNVFQVAPPPPFVAPWG
jgi:4-carboxymuconolactone decarboxylase